MSVNGSRPASDTTRAPRRPILWVGRILTAVPILLGDPSFVIPLGLGVIAWGGHLLPGGAPACALAASQGGNSSLNARGAGARPAPGSATRSTRHKEYLNFDL